MKTLSAIVVFLSLLQPVHARDSGQWGNEDKALREWYQGLMQPDVPTASCCGTSDAYWCDDIHTRKEPKKNGEGLVDVTVCKITDDRDDIPRGRHHIPMGTEIVIPNNKLKWDSGNPTGHAIVFVNSNNYVFCFVQGGGV